MSYSDYLKSSHWKKIKERKKATVDHCQVCNSKKNLHVHHKKYIRTKLEVKHKHKTDSVGTIFNRERDEDLLVLCASCHKLTHHYFKKNPFEKRNTGLRKKYRVQIRRMLERGVEKNKAFWIASDKELTASLYNKIMKKPQKINIAKGDTLDMLEKERQI